MKKFYSIIFLLAIFLGKISANDYFVDPVGGKDTNDGLSWTTAFKNLSKVDLVVTNDASGNDRIFIKGGEIKLSSGTKYATKPQSYFFSCGGTEIEPEQREKVDQNGDGVIDKWEFKNPTVLKLILNNNGNGYALLVSPSSVVDGLTINYTGSNNGATNTGVSSVKCDNSILQNSIISNCNVTFSFTNFTKNSAGALLYLTLDAVVRDCLIEKNYVSIKNNGGPTGIQSPYLSAVACLGLNSAGTAGANNPKMYNVVVRNNKAVYDYSDAINVDASSIRSLVLGVSNTAVSTGVVDNFESEGSYTNCLVYNNEFEYIGNSTIPVAKNASLAGLHFLRGGKATIRNCTFANNKLTNMKSAMHILYKRNISYKIYNNVFWNNQNTVNGLTKTVSLSSDTIQNDTTIVSHNVMDVDTVGLWGGKLLFQANVKDLAQLNSGANAPNFKNPTLFVGANRVAGSADSTAIAQSKWSLNVGSYLIEKGFAYVGIDKDFAGLTFAVNPAVGAYEFVNNTAIITPESSMCFGRIVGTEYISNISQIVGIYSVTGFLIVQKQLAEGETILLPKGVSLIKAITPTGSSVRKVVL